MPSIKLSKSSYKIVVIILELGFSIGFWTASLLFAEKGKL